MTRNERAMYRERLSALLGRIGQDRSQLVDEALQGVGGEASGGLSNVPLHAADLGSHESEEDVTFGLLKNEEQLLGEIQDALARLDQGIFGVCENCHRPIATERLHTVPYARRCTACERKTEARPVP
jgi:RNA polymerase-binding transcription factor DksA